MQIYVRVDEDGFGEHAWIYRDSEQHYLVDKCFHQDGEPWATAFKTVKEAKKYGKAAKLLMLHDGAAGKVTVSYWRIVRGKMLKTKFTKDNRIA